MHLCQPVCGRVAQGQQSSADEEEKQCCHSQLGLAISIWLQLKLLGILPLILSHPKIHILLHAYFYYSRNSVNLLHVDFSFLLDVKCISVLEGNLINNVQNQR